MVSVVQFLHRVIRVYRSIEECAPLIKMSRWNNSIIVQAFSLRFVFATAIKQKRENSQFQLVNAIGLCFMPSCVHVHAFPPCNEY